MKVCTKCKEIKALDDFEARKDRNGQRRSQCRVCVSLIRSAYREANKERIRQYDKDRDNSDQRREERRKRAILKQKTIKNFKKSHVAISRATSSGRIIRPNICSWCNIQDVPIQGHHEDYNNPLSVVWLCASCHTKLHIGVTPESHKMREKIKTPTKEFYRQEV